jgi:hypothetical protein
MYCTDSNVWLSFSSQTWHEYWLWGSGSFDVSVDHKHLAVANINDGVDIYEMQTGSFRMSCPRQACNAPPLVFLHGGRALLTTDSKGCTNLWSVKRGAIIGTLSHGYGAIVTALTVSLTITHGENIITLVPGSLQGRERLLFNSYWWRWGKDECPHLGGTGSPRKLN